MGSRCTTRRSSGSTPSQEPGTRFYSLDDNDSVPELGGSRDRLAGVRPQAAAHRGADRRLCTHPPASPRSCAADSASVGEVLKILDKLVPDVEQVIDLPMIFPSHFSLLSPGAADGPTVGGSAWVSVGLCALCLGVVRAAGHTWAM